MREKTKALKDASQVQPSVENKGNLSQHADGGINHGAKPETSVIRKYSVLELSELGKNFKQEKDDPVPA